MKKPLEGGIEVLEHHCIFCGQTTEEGIHLRGRLICSECERKLVNTKVDEPAYQDYKQRLKIIWHNNLPKTNSHFVD